MFDKLRKVLGDSQAAREEQLEVEPAFRPAKLPPRRSVHAPKTASLPGGDGWTAHMGWRHVTYIEGTRSLSFQIEPMAVGADIVYIPDTQAAWSRSAPPWAASRASEILDRLKSVAWRRELEWSESVDSSFLTSDAPVPGSLESTPGGQQLEAERLFHPGSPLAHTQAHEVWHLAARRFAEAARGRVSILASGVDPKTVFGAVELPALRANPNVTLDFK
jgi:hypothetical protein